MFLSIFFLANPGRRYEIEADAEITEVGFEIFYDEAWHPLILENGWKENSFTAAFPNLEGVENYAVRITIANEHGTRYTQEIPEAFLLL